MLVNFSLHIDQNYNLFSIKGKILTDLESNFLIEQIDDLIKKHKYPIILNIKELEHITSTGLNFFIRALTRCRNNSIELVIYGLQPSVEKLFYISKLNEIFVIFADEIESINYVEQRKQTT